MSEELLNRAIALARAGKKEEARSLLEPLLEVDRQNITAWLWYADTWPDDDQKMEALELCLKYNPNHPTIQRALTLLQSRQESSLPQPLTILAQPAAPTTQEPTMPTESTPSIKTSPTLLDQRIEDYAKAGWQIVHRTPTAAQLKRPKQWRRGCLVISALFLIISYCLIAGGIIASIDTGISAGGVIVGTGLLLLSLAAIDYALNRDELIYLTEEQLREEYRKAEEQLQQEEAARRAKQDRLRELKRRTEIRKHKHSKGSTKRIMPPKQFRILAILGGVTVLLLVVAMGLFLILPSWRLWQAGTIATATARVHNTATAQAAYFLTQSVAPTSTPRPTNTPDLRSPFEKCVQSGQGVRYVITGNGVSGVSVTWENDTGGTEQGDYELPFCVTYLGFRRGDFLYISAQIIQPTSGAGSIQCRIYQGNTIIAEANARGFASIATCSGLAR